MGAEGSVLPGSPGGVHNLETGIVQRIPMLHRKRQRFLQMFRQVPIKGSGPHEHHFFHRMLEQFKLKVFQFMTDVFH